MFSSPSASIVRSALALLSLLAVGVSCSEADAAFVVQFDTAAAKVRSTGAEQVISVDLLISYEADVNPNTLSSFTIDIVRPTAGLTLANPKVADYNWDSGPSISSTASVVTIGASNFASGNYLVTAGPPSRLMSLDFILDASVISETFPLDLSLRNASRNVFTNIAPEFTLPAGQFVVTAVPEPTSLAMVGILAIAITYVRRSSLTRKCNL